MHLYLIAAAVAAAVVFGFGYRAGKASVQGDLDALRAAYTQAALDAEQRARQAEKEKADAVAEVTRQADEKLRALAADRARAVGAAERLRVAAERAGAECRAPKDAAAADAGETAADSGVVLADVLGRCAARLVELAEYADRAAAAGAACERAYDSVTGARR